MRRRVKRDRLDGRLESERPQPRDEFVSTLADRLAPDPIRRRPVWRTALVAGFTMLLVVAFALTGGISYAANAVHGGTTAVAALVTGPSSSDKPKPNKPEQSNNGSSATASSSSSESTESSSQASDKVVVCHIPPGNTDNPQTISVGESAVPAHLEHGDTLGPCDDGGPADDQYNEKVLICHIPPGNPENPQTIRVSENAVPAHLAHGDTEGPCPGEE